MNLVKCYNQGSFILFFNGWPVSPAELPEYMEYLLKTKHCYQMLNIVVRWWEKWPNIDKRVFSKTTKKKINWAMCWNADMKEYLSVSSKKGMFMQSNHIREEEEEHMWPFLHCYLCEFVLCSLCVFIFRLKCRCVFWSSKLIVKGKGSYLTFNLKPCLAL